MNKIIAAVAIAVLPLAGCASAKGSATSIVAASDVAADTLADAWKQGTQTRVDECRALDLRTEEERAECLGLFHPDEIDKVIAAVKVLVAVQLSVKEAAECEALKTCPAEVDWKALAAQAREAWEALKPYVLAVRKENGQ